MPGQKDSTAFDLLSSVVNFPAVQQALSLQGSMRFSLCQPSMVTAVLTIFMFYFKGGPSAPKEADEGILSDLPALPYQCKYCC